MLVDLVEALEKLVNRPIVKESNLSDYKVESPIRIKLLDKLNTLGYTINTYTSAHITQEATEKKAANFAIMPNQYFALACEFYELSIELKKYFDYFEKSREHGALLVGTFEKIKSNIRSSKALRPIFDSDEDIDLFAKFLDREEDKYRLGGKRIVNDEGKPRSSDDCFSSIILKLTNMPAVASTSFGKLVWDLACNQDLFLKLFETYNSKVNTGEKEILRHGSMNHFAKHVFEYFHHDVWKDVVGEAKKTDRAFGEHKFQALHYRDFKVLLARFDSRQKTDALRSGGILRFFAEPVFEDESGTYYFSTQWNGETERSLSFKTLNDYITSAFPGYLVRKDESVYKLVRFKNDKFSNMTRLPKPFLLLAGISGTGKTRFVRKQAESHSGALNNLRVVSVRPDWHEPSDLLGYFTRLSGAPEYIMTPVLLFIIEAWKSIAPNATAEGPGQLDYNSPPYWLCLDEMNLAPVEQYFADYLSVLESRKFTDGGYECLPLLPDSVIQTEGAGMQKTLGLKGSQGLWEYFENFGIPLPPNLIVAGTVNMDETTHGFSRKVIDRAITLDFGEFFPNEFANFFEGQKLPATFTYPRSSKAIKTENYCDADSDGSKTIAFLDSVNQVLRGTPFELAYRALNELLLHLESFSPVNQQEIEAIWDDFMMTKVLPRIEGDEDKLRMHGEGAEFDNVLEGLLDVLGDALPEIWSDDSFRPDLFRTNGVDQSSPQIKCRAKKKLNWMLGRLKTNTFTSYWP